MINSEDGARRRMSRRLLERIRYAILSGEYDLPRHAIDEMAEDGLGIFDVESAILDGEIKDGTR